MAFWSCSSCTFVNQGISKTCQVCQQTKRVPPPPPSPSLLSSPFLSSLSQSPSLKLFASSSSSSSSSSSFDRDTSRWGCRACNFLNRQVDVLCEICGTPKSSISLDAFAEFDSILDDDEDGDNDENKVGKKGTKFWPLRSCTFTSVQQSLKESNVSQTKKQNENESLFENSEESLFKNTKNGEALLLKNIKNTEESLMKNTKECLSKNTKNNDEPVFKNTKNTKRTKESPFKNTKTNAESLFKSINNTEESLFKDAEDLASNMARSTTSNGSKKRKSPGDDYGSSGNASCDMLGQKIEIMGIDRIKQPLVKALGRRSGTVGDGNLSIVVLTYNVWFREDLELTARMNAIGGIICEHNPHFVCLQEVTPEIYNLFQCSSWWNDYQCSVTSSFASKRAYFCLQLSRVPKTSFSKSPYGNTVMGRELCISKVGDIAGGRELLVATTHLESPCPSPPTWDQMFSIERVAQAKQAFHALEDHPNVVFCGDMNWDDKLDGHPPLPQGWCDAWLTLRPNEEGLTYDSKENPMLFGSRLRKRLDRMFCRLDNFQLESVERVGMEPIPGVTFEKETKAKKKPSQTVKLPVLPSDHFGLLLKISPRS